MELKQLYREIVNDHNLTPSHRGKMENPDIVLQGVNPSCGDNIYLYLKVKDGMIEDGTFTGVGCAISQASVDMMLDNIIGKSEDKALEIAENFMKMIKGESLNENEVDDLEECALLSDISHMPARVKCAVLGWRTLEEMLK
ncbi:Fe-S cluster assembly sulfur transfer protein SufU [Lachnobacterium bovis]|uniref:Nitrogen fixation protein NifU n=1 Tax=Lachnobacterium bovis TaxID=140626 RepID=A0A1H9SFE8_9FIRM|nr:SUF system NifU family Fe-S cluster assembly protein [Lachnobacterium bovis]SER83093.1 nitrogen fixation protein NifU [Lachnobacterium bovis]